MFGSQGERRDGGQKASPLLKGKSLGGGGKGGEEGGKGDVILTEVESYLTVDGLLPFKGEVVRVGGGVGVGKRFCCFSDDYDVFNFFISNGK